MAMLNNQGVTPGNLATDSHHVLFFGKSYVNEILPIAILQFQRVSSCIATMKYVVQ